MKTLTIVFKDGNTVEVKEFAEFSTSYDVATTYSDFKLLSLNTALSYTFFGKTTVTVKGEDVLYLLVH